tara:strand:+ start:262 stop:1659 length:1398 start_codon:yes stop_codon:yes gene_type:complete
MIPRFRFAPSPTGKLHIGGVRTALFNFLLAKNYNGKFLLRIEDTDLLRSKQEYTKQILEALELLGLSWNEKIIYQSKRTDRYRETIQNLLNEGKAYRCFSKRDELDEIREKTGTYYYPGIWRDRSNIEIKKELSKNTPFTIRLKTPSSGTIGFKDLIYGDVEVSNKEIDDFIIARSDGSPVYNVVVVIDDHDMKISHVVRGEDHLANTPKQILVYEALGWVIPKFVHLPMILGADGKRLSKRNGATGLDYYIHQGYQPEVIINYLSLLGWNPGTKEEIMSIDTLIEKFDLGQVNKKSAVFDMKKLDWFSSQHLSIQPDHKILSAIRNIMPDWGGVMNDKYCTSVIKISKPRSISILDLVKKSEYFFSDPKLDDQNEIWDTDSRAIVKSMGKTLEKNSEWDSKSIEDNFKYFSKNSSLGLGKIIKPLRVIMCGTLNGPSIYDIMDILGKNTCMLRISKMLKFIKNN